MFQFPKPPEEIKTPRLLLKRIQPSDAKAVFHAYASDLETLKYLAFEPHTCVKTVEEFLLSRKKCWDAGTDFPYSLRLKSKPEEIIGTVGLHVRQQWKDPQPGQKFGFGYVLTKTLWGQGYMTDAVTSLLEWATEQPTTWRVDASCALENTGSARVMEKSGMYYEGILRRYMVFPNLSPEPGDVHMYAWVRD